MPFSTCFVVIKDTRCFTKEYDFSADINVVCCDHCLWNFGGSFHILLMIHYSVESEKVCVLNSGAVRK